MQDAMVTARMSQDKKALGTRMLEHMGTNASQAINQLFDYVIENGDLPFARKHEVRKLTQEDLTRAAEWARGVRHPRESHFDSMTKTEIRAERLASRGLWIGGGDEASR